jgi:hypothetical protein
MWENIYKSAVKLSEMALPQTMKVSPVSLEHQSAIFFWVKIIANGISVPFT